MVVSIIGGGISGLTAGVLLLKNGYSVNIYEKNNNAGGFCTSWKRGGVIIDGCLHWLIGTHEKSAIGKIWREIGGIRGDEFTKLDNFCKVYFDGETVTFYNDFDKLETELLRVCASDGDRVEIARLIDTMRYIGMYETDSSAPPELKTPTPPSLEFTCRTIKLLKCTVGDYAEKFDSPILRYAFYNSLVDRHLSMLYLATTLANMCSGNANLPIGGSTALIANVVEKFESLGGKLFLNTPVSDIVIENGVATGITLPGGETVKSDHVIAACDVHHTFEKLLGGRVPYDTYKRCDADKTKYPTYSFIVASFKTKADLSNRDVVEIFKTEPFEILDKNYDVLSVRHYGYDRSLMTDGYTVIEVFVTTYEDDYERLKAMSRERYKAFKKKTGNMLRDKLAECYAAPSDDIELVDVLTPLTYERYLNSYKGCFMSYPLGVKTPQILHSSRVDEVKNLYLANQWLMLPGGTPIAIIAGKFAAQSVLAVDGKAIS